MLKLNDNFESLSLTERHQAMEQITEFSKGIGVKVSPLSPEEGIDFRYDLAGNKHQILAIRLYMDFLAKDHS